jgi:hypothetical protein
MMSRLHAFLLRRWLLAGCACSVLGPVAAQTAASPPADLATSAAVVARTPRFDETVELERMEVKARLEDAGYDATGMGSYEHQLRDSPFSNDMISAEALEDDPAAVEVATELAVIATPSAVDPSQPSSGA